MGLLEDLYEEHGKPDSLQTFDIDKVCDKEFYTKVEVDLFVNTLNEEQKEQFNDIMRLRKEIEERLCYLCFKRGVNFMVQLMTESGADND